MVKLQEEENRSGKSKTDEHKGSNDELSNLASTLFKDQNVDLGKVVNMASNLVANETLMKSVIDFAKLKPVQQEPLQNAANTNLDQVEFSSQMEQLTTELAKIRQELQTLKEQTEQIKDTIMLMNERTSKKFLGLF
jgi:hypothetical protein